tara:strand:+ start:8676 stop:9107 length:432 start_codon:yes stop_codon:yes gene_type:complete
MKGQFRVINSRISLEEAIQELRNKWEQDKWLMIQTTTEKQRSQLQNNSLHLWLQMVADELNRQGFDVRQVLEMSKRQEITWTAAAVKEHLWRPVQQAYNGKKSTTQASTSDYPAIYDILNKTLAEKMGVFVPWPCKENMGSAA